jgi:putative endonuclease
VKVKDAVGRFGEHVAAGHLQADGLTILARNWRCRAGELDIVALDGSALVFIEVKTRSSLAFGSPAEAIDHAKIKRIRRLAMLWIGEYRDRDVSEGTAAYWASVRFDVICIVRRTRGGLEVEHLRSAF